MNDTCTCHHPESWHSGPYTACGAMNCRCTRFEALEREDECEPDTDGEFDDTPPKMEFGPRVGFREEC